MTAEPFVTEWLEYLVEEDRMDRFQDPDDWKIPYALLTEAQQEALLDAPELYPAMEREQLAHIDERVGDE